MTVKDKITSDTRNFQQQEEEEEDNYKPEKVDKRYSDDFITYKSRDNKTLSIEEYLISYLKDIINYLKRKYHARKIQLIIAINCLLKSLMTSYNDLKE